MSQISELNDAFRTNLQEGQILLTRGVAALPAEIVADALQRVRVFDEFTIDNDPHEEHDFGSVELSGHKFFFKIDYYDKELVHGSEDPADPDRTTRVLTVMRAEEY